MDMSLPDYAALELLVAIADHGSLASAARAVGMAQPNASRSLARLERSLGLTLAHRSTRGSYLSTDGLMVVELARGVLAAGKVFEDGVAAMQTDEPVKITVMASQTVAEHLLPGWIAAWRAKNPGVAITVRVGNTSEVLAAARSGEISLGFIEGPQAPGYLNSVVVSHDELVLTLAPSHPWAGRSSVNADELAATALITRETGSGTRVALERALAPRICAPALLELPNNAAVRVSAIAGSGPAVLSALAVSQELDAGTLISIPVEDVDLRRNLRAVWAGPRRLADPRATSLLEIAVRS